jgi:hypothetical protein
MLNAVGRLEELRDSLSSGGADLASWLTALASALFCHCRVSRTKTVFIMSLNTDLYPAFCNKERVRACDWTTASRQLRHHAL